MILANDPRGFSCREVHALFRPFRPHHLNPSCGCGRAGCPIWRTVKKLGVRHLYRSIFGLLPEIDFIVDSSKDPLWIDRQTRYLRADGFTCKNILIWKSPAEMEASCRKRGHGNHWARKWTAYHRLYFSVVPHYAACSYGPLITDPTLLSAVCEYLGIPVIAGKEQYWNKTHHTLFGNASAKIHTHSIDDSNYFAAEKHLSQRPGSDRLQLCNTHRSIHYEPCSDVDISNSREYIKYRTIVRAIEDQLTAFDVCQQLSTRLQSLEPIPTFGPVSLLIRRLAWSRPLRRLTSSLSATQHEVAFRDGK